jgi:hypothetical protein
MEDLKMNRQSQWLFEAPPVSEASLPQTHAFALARVIPDDPNYRKYVPINYRLNAKKIVGEVAQDLSSRGKSAHFWVDLAHGGMTVVEMSELVAEASILAGVLAIASPLLGMVGVFLALGAPYVEEAEEIAANWSATGFSRGVVMGADKRRAHLVKDYFGNDFFPRRPSFPKGRSIAIANYRMGLLVGYVNGRVLSQNQRTIFWRDLGHRIGDQSYRGPTGQWKRRQWVSWYTDVASVFRRNHLV